VDANYRGDLSKLVNLRHLIWLLDARSLPKVSSRMKII
jgi:hypothetical protein